MRLCMHLETVGAEVVLIFPSAVKVGDLELVTKLPRDAEFDIQPCPEG